MDTHRIYLDEYVLYLKLWSASTLAKVFWRKHNHTDLENWRRNVDIYVCTDGDQGDGCKSNSGPINPTDTSDYLVDGKLDELMRSEATWNSQLIIHLTLTSQWPCALFWTTGTQCIQGIAKRGHSCETVPDLPFSIPKCLCEHDREIKSNCIWMISKQTVTKIAISQIIRIKWQLGNVQPKNIQICMYSRVQWFFK